MPGTLAAIREAGRQPNAGIAEPRTEGDRSAWAPDEWLLAAPVRTTEDQQA
jgi:hypothetical protein